MKSLSLRQFLIGNSQHYQRKSQQGGLEGVKKIVSGEAYEPYVAKIAVYKVKMLAGAAAK